MINNPKEIVEILNELDNLTFDQLNKAIQITNQEFDNNSAEMYTTKKITNITKISTFYSIESQQIELSDILKINFKENIINKEGENNIWMKEQVLVA